MDEHVERPERGDLVEDTLGGDVAADEDRLRAERRQLLGGLGGGRVGAEVADRDARGSELGKAQGDRLPDPPRSPGHEDRSPLEAHDRRGSGAYAGAELGSSSQPIRSADSREPSSAFEDA